MKELENMKRMRNKPARYCNTSDDESKAVQGKNSGNGIPLPPTNYLKQHDKSLKTLENPPLFHRSKTEGQEEVSAQKPIYKSMSPVNSIVSNNEFFGTSREHSPQRSTDFHRIDDYDIPIKIGPTNSQQTSANTGQLLSTLADIEHQVDDQSIPHSCKTMSQDHCCCQEVLNEMKSLKTMVTSIYLTLSNKNDMVDIEKKKIDFGFPIQTQDQLNEFEKKIKNVTGAVQYQRMVSNIGGACFKKHVRNVLVLTVTDSMAYRMTWTGSRENSIGVKNLNFIRFITDTIIEKWSSADISKVESVMKTWFQKAGDRLKKK